MALGRSGSEVEIALRGSGKDAKATAYHAVAVRGRGRGVLVLDEAGDHAKDVCDRLARAGFAALAPDLSAGAAKIRIEAGLRYLLDDASTDGPRIGLLGFEAGGALALEFRDADGRIGCIVDCGGVPDLGSEEAPAELSRLPTLLVFGEEDEGVEAARRLEQVLSAPHLRLLPGAAGGFMDAARADRHDPVAAASAWDAVLSFLEASL